MSETQSDFQADSKFLEVLLSMGISESIAREALFCTGNSSTDAAINYIFNSSGSDSQPGEIGEGGPIVKVHGKNESQTQGGDDEWEDEEDTYYKMVFVVNKSLKMGVGKIAAQVGHACLGLYRDMIEISMECDCHLWEESGEKKIVLKGNSTEHLIELYDKAKDAKIPAYLVRDAGHTQIPRGSVTVLSLFGIDENVDKITGKLSLL